MRAWHSAIGTASAANAWRPTETAQDKVAFTHADVGTEAACLGFVNGAAQKFGRLDILINNAGIRKYEKVDEASAGGWNEILSVNLIHELRLLCQGGGSADAPQQGWRHR